MVQELERQVNKLVQKCTRWITVCAWCNHAEVEGVFLPVEQLPFDATRAEFSHGICPHCRQEMYAAAVARFPQKKRQIQP